MKPHPFASDCLGCECVGTPAECAAHVGPPGIGFGTTLPFLYLFQAIQPFGASCRMDLNCRKCFGLEDKFGNGCTPVAIPSTFPAPCEAHRSYTTCTPSAWAATLAGQPGLPIVFAHLEVWAIRAQLKYNAEEAHVLALSHGAYTFPPINRGIDNTFATPPYLFADIDTPSLFNNRDAYFFDSIVGQTVLPGAGIPTLSDVCPDNTWMREMAVVTGGGANGLFLKSRCACKSPYAFRLYTLQANRNLDCRACLAMHTVQVSLIVPPILPDILAVVGIGSSCLNPSISFYCGSPICSEHGTCMRKAANGTDLVLDFAGLSPLDGFTSQLAFCECDFGYFPIQPGPGFDCSVTCFDGTAEHPTCSGHGTCFYFGFNPLPTCVCDLGYYGVVCQYTCDHPPGTGFLDPTCGGRPHISCLPAPPNFNTSLPPECQCDTGYTFDLFSDCVTCVDFRGLDTTTCNTGSCSLTSPSPPPVCINCATGRFGPACEFAESYQFTCGIATPLPWTCNFTGSLLVAATSREAADFTYSCDLPQQTLTAGGVSPGDPLDTFSLEASCLQVSIFKRDLSVSPLADWLFDGGTGHVLPISDADFCRTVLEQHRLNDGSCISVHDQSRHDNNRVSVRSVSEDRFCPVPFGDSVIHGAAAISEMGAGAGGRMCEPPWDAPAQTHLYAQFGSRRAWCYRIFPWLGVPLDKAAMQYHCIASRQDWGDKQLDCLIYLRGGSSPGELDFWSSAGLDTDRTSLKLISVIQDQCR